MNMARIINNEEKINNPSSLSREARSDNLGLQKLSSSYSINKVQKRSFHSNVRGMNRIGPHNKDTIDVIIGSILGKAYSNNRSGEGVRICYRQSDRHKEYLF